MVRSSLSCGAYLTIAHALLQKHLINGSQPLQVLYFSILFNRADAYWHKLHGIHACAFAVETE